MNLNATIFGQAIAFFIFVWFCMKYIWPPIMGAIEKRQKEITNSLASAERAKKYLDLAQIDANQYLEAAKLEARELIKEANKHKIQIINAAKVEAEQERKKIMTQAQIEIEVEFKRANEKLRKQVLKLALSGAEKIIECSIDEVVNSNIIDKLVAEI
ncbi:ATP synthase B chain [Serratia symbiotica str. 'Cinara cedri']|nr:ATP synthase B chain [Serratia symbiotica str. 'Cinara cedri']